MESYVATCNVPFRPLQLKSLPRTQLHRMKKRTAHVLRKILSKKEVQRIYECIVKDTYRTRVENYLGRLKEAQCLRQNWGMSAVTLAGDAVLIDRPDCYNSKLLKGYQVCVALHHFSHFLTQQIDPADRYKEAGYQTEKQLFGQVLLALKDPAARVLLDWAESEMERREFERKFGQKNGVSSARSLHTPALYLL